MVGPATCSLLQAGNATLGSLPCHQFPGSVHKDRPGVCVSGRDKAGQQFTMSAYQRLTAARFLFLQSHYRLPSHFIL